MKRLKKNENGRLHIYPILGTLCSSTTSIQVSVISFSKSKIRKMGLEWTEKALKK